MIKDKKKKTTKKNIKTQKTENVNLDKKTLGEVKREKRKNNFLKEFENSIGLITPACKKAGIDYITYVRWYNKDKEFAKKVDEIEEGFGIVVEEKLKAKIANGDGNSIRFYLGRRIPKYKPKTELSTPDDFDFNITIKEK